MTQSMINIKLIYMKEVLGMWRSFKWLWVPLVMLILGITQPITTKLMPQILSSAGGISPELLQQLSTPQPGEVLIQVLSQYNIVGVLILVLPLMGIISGEIQHGIALNFMMKPIKPSQYVLAKWLSALSLAIPSFMLGYGGSWYYTNVLIGAVDNRAALVAGLYYLLWIVLVITVAVAVSGLVNQVVGGAAITVGTVLLTTIIGGMLPGQWGWYPSRLSDLAVMELANQTPLYSAWWPSSTIAILILLLLLVTIVRNRKRSNWVQSSSIL